MPLNHVALTVSDRELSADFYGQDFGLSERVHDDEHLLILGSPDGSLVALSDGPVPNGQDGDGFVRVQVADPDGYRVELFAFDDRPAPPMMRRPPRSRWTSFLADSEEEKPRILCELGNPAHRLRVEHNRETLLVHLSNEDGKGWTVLAVDRATRRWTVAQARRQLDAVEAAYARLYSDA